MQFAIDNRVTRRQQEKNQIDVRVAIARRPGLTVTKLAKKLGYARNTLNLAINRGLFPEVMRAIKKELRIP